MKNPILHPLDKWYGAVFTDTTDPGPQSEGAPAPEEPYSPEPPVNTDFCQNPFGLNI